MRWAFSISFCWLQQNDILFLLQLSASNNHQQRSSGYAADLLDVAPELLPLCLALLAKFFGVFGLFAATLFAGVPEFLSHRGSPWRLDSNIHFYYDILPEKNN